MGHKDDSFLDGTKRPASWYIGTSLVGQELDKRTRMVFLSRGNRGHHHHHHAVGRDATKTAFITCNS
jgi:hypothetical protein